MQIERHVSVDYLKARPAEEFGVCDLQTTIWLERPLQAPNMNHVFAGRNIRNDDLTIGRRCLARLRGRRPLSLVESLQSKIQVSWNLALPVRNQTHPHGKSPQCRTHIDVDLLYRGARRDVD